MQMYALSQQKDIHFLHCHFLQTFFLTRKSSLQFLNFPNCPKLISCPILSPEEEKSPLMLQLCAASVDV